MTMNMGANMLGLDNAATPLGIKAMQELQKLNPTPDTASDRADPVSGDQHRIGDPAAVTIFTYRASSAPPTPPTCSCRC